MQGFSLSYEDLQDHPLDINGKKRQPEFFGIRTVLKFCSARQDKSFNAVILRGNLKIKAVGLFSGGVVKTMIVTFSIN